MKLVFDFGGVVFRWEPQQFLMRLLPARAPTRSAARRLALEFFQAFGGDWGEFDRGRIDPGALAGRIAARLGLALDEARRVIDAIPDELQPVPETVELLQRLHAAGETFFFLSNMPDPYARHLEANHDVLRFFERGVYSSRVGLIKPEPAIFVRAAAVFDAAPAELLLIDDIEANVEAAKHAGWRGLQFYDARRCAADLAAMGLG